MKANKQAVSPKTKQPYTGTTALCLGCHEDSAKGGQGYAPVSGHISHPFGLAAVCHPIKADGATVAEKIVLFTSMDETGNRVLAAKAQVPSEPAKAPAAAPARTEKKSKR